MSWHELSISVPFEYVEPVSYLFERYGYGLSVETRPGDCAVLRSYLPSLSRQRLAHIEVGVKLASSVADWANWKSGPWARMKIGGIPGSSISPCCGWAGTWWSSRPGLSTKRGTATS